MGIRRRRRKLTTTLTSMETRLKSVELRPISLLTTEQVNAAVTTPVTQVEDRFFIGDDAPNTYNVVHDAYYYPKKLTGKDNDLVEIYTQGSLNRSVDERIEISGIHGGASSLIDVSNTNFSVTEVEESPWTGRASYKHDPTQDQLPGVVIGYAYSVVPETLAPTSLNTRLRLETRAAIQSYEITGTTVTVTTPTTHRFKVDDVIYNNLNEDAIFNPVASTAYGVDGLFRISAVTSNTISWQIPAGVGLPTGTIVPTASDVYVFATARSWCAVGDTWVDTSGASEVTYYWSGIRWTEFTATSTGAGADTTPPNPVANVAVVVAESGSYADSSGTPRARITLSWEAPTQDSDGDPLTDLAGYEVWYSYTNGSEWIKSGVIVGEEKYTATNLDPARTVYFKVYAVDSSLNRSTAVDFSAVSGSYASVLNPPSAPILESDLGVVTARWNGLDNTGVIPHPSIRLIETHVSTTNNFTPSLSTRVASMTASTDNYSSVYQFRNGLGTLQNMAYETDYYFKFVAVDASGNRTTGSGQTIGRISQVDGAAIKAGAISAKILEGETIVATSNTSPFQIELNANFLRAVNKSTGAETFKMQTSNGAVTIGAGITNTTINGSLISVQNINANNITSGTINASVIGVTNLNASNITSGTINANVISVTNLNASNITFGTLNGNNVTVQNLSASAITTGTFSGDRISGGTITGTTVSGGTLITSGTRRVEISGSNANFFDGNGALSGRVTAGEAGRAATMYFGTGISGVFAYNGGMDLEANGAVKVTGGGGLTSAGLVTADAGLVVTEGQQFRTSVIRRAGANGQINYITSAGTVIAYFDTSAASAGTTQLWILSNGSAVSWVNRSSRRYKTNINDYSDPSDKILDLRAVTYQANPAAYGMSEEDGDSMPLGKLEVGLIAEEVAEAGLDVLVAYSSQDPNLVEGLDYTRIGVMLIPIVKRLKEEIAELKAKVENL